MIRRKVVIAGGTGYIGKHLSARLQALGYHVHLLSRWTLDPPASGGWSSSLWDARTVGSWSEELEDAYAVINLCGRPIRCRWTAWNRKQILESRVLSTEAIGGAIKMCKNPPPVWLNASAVGVYGDAGSRQVNESTDPGEGFLAEACIAWERALDESETPETRQVCMRMGVVIGCGDPSITRLIQLVKCFMGCTIGRGNQYISWVYIDDLIRIMLWFLESDAEGTYNLTAPSAVMQKELMILLRKRLSRPWVPPIPAFVFRLFGKLIGLEPELVLSSQRVLPQKLLESGFEFVYPTIEKAVASLLNSSRSLSKGPQLPLGS